MGVPLPVAQGALRLSLGALSTPESVDRLVEVLGTLAAKARGPVAAFA
jgi:cysteine sulfinate desulfinase/cysteine desulfurase-like protein